MKAKKYPHLCAVSVSWVDSTFDEGWRYHGPNHASRELEPIATMGFVTACHKDALEVTSTIGVKQGMLNPLRIPWGAIKTVKVIVEPKHGQE